MAIFRVAKHVLTDPPTLNGLLKTFPDMKEFTPYADNLYKWYRTEGSVMGTKLPEGEVEIDLMFDLVSPSEVKVSWKIKQ